MGPSRGKAKGKAKGKGKCKPPKVAEATFERSMLRKQIIHMLDGNIMMRLKISIEIMTQRN